MDTYEKAQQLYEQMLEEAEKRMEENKDDPEILTELDRYKDESNRDTIVAALENVQQEYGIEPKDIQIEMDPNRKMQLYYENSLGDAYSIGQIEPDGSVKSERVYADEKGNVRIVDYADRLKQQLEYEKTIDFYADAERRKSKEASVDISVYGHGQAVNRVKDQIRQENDARLASEAMQKKQAQREAIKGVKDQYKDLPNSSAKRKAEKQAIHDIKYSDGVQARADYETSKEKVASLEQQLDDLYRQASQEIATARANGAPAQDCQMSQGTAEKIKNTTAELAKKKVEQRKDFVEMENKNSPIIKMARNTAEAMKAAERATANNGRLALASIRDTVHDMNHKVIVEGKTAAYYEGTRGLKMEVSKIANSWRNINQQIDRATSKVIDKYKEAVEKHYEKSIVRKDAMHSIGSNLKSLFTGKRQEQQQQNTEGLTDKQQKHLDRLQKMSDWFKDASIRVNQKIMETAKANIGDLSKLQGERDEAGVTSKFNEKYDIGYSGRIVRDTNKFKEQFNKAIENATKTAEGQKKNAGPAKETKTKDEPIK